MLRTAESVTIGHPDKICDQIVDAILDEILKQDPIARVALEALGGHGKLVITGEVTTNAVIDIPAISQKTYTDIGYTSALEIETKISKQSPDIARGVDTGGAGDQGIMVGYATKETPEMLPKPTALARRLVQKLQDFRNGARKPASPVLPDGRQAGGDILGPDGKTQVTMIGERVSAVVVSTQQKENVSIEELRRIVTENVIAPVILDFKNANVFINSAGPFVLGGFDADSGVSGRKIVVDNYGPDIPVGGGSYPGKDPTKVDRSAAYMARYLAKYAVLKYNVAEALVKLAYAIGVKEPLMVEVERVGEKARTQILKDFKKNFDLTPQGIINFLDLRRPIYLQATRLGNFGDPSLLWEQVKI